MIRSRSCPDSFSIRPWLDEDRLFGPDIPDLDRSVGTEKRLVSSASERENPRVALHVGRVIVL